MHENFAEAYRVLGRSLPGGAVWESEGATAVATGVDRPEFNRLFVLDEPADVETLLDHAEAFFANAEVPWCVVAPPEVAPSLKNASGLEAGPYIPGMVLEGPPVTATVMVPGLHVEPVSTADDGERFVTALARGFETQRELFRLFGHPAVIAQPHVSHYLGVLDGQAVATATLVVSHGIAGLFNISTVPGRRRRGIGEVLTRHALAEGHAQGCASAALQATRPGYPLYEAMGFRHVLDYRTWFPLEV